MNYSGLAAGIAIGAAAAVLTVLATGFQKEDEFGGVLLVFGKVIEVRDDILIVDQAGEETGQEPQPVNIKMDGSTIIFRCGDPPGYETCNIPVDSGKIISGTPVCGYVRLVNGEVYGGKIFLHSECIVSR